MQEKVAAKEEVYTNSLLLGNAFYNITHFGNARIFMSPKLRDMVLVPIVLESQSKNDYGL